MPIDPASGFAERPEISARSVVVTVFGDSVVPLGGEIWLGDLIALVRPFGFSDRLIRTSVTRLTNEGWFDTERVGRRSRYRLTPDGRREFEDAERRIYYDARPAWNQQWTLAFTEATGVDPVGFAKLARGVYGYPGDARDRLDQWPDPPPLTAVATFADLDRLRELPGLRNGFDLDAVEAGYREFLHRYPTEPVASATDTAEAYVCRTIVLHDFRRVVLADPLLPAEVVGAGWIGDQARASVIERYTSNAEAAWTWVETQTGLCRDHTLVETRFA